MANKRFPYLDDKDFLAYVDKLHLKEQHVRVTALTFDEKPIESITGHTLGGSINIDGHSAVRRTCNISMLADENNNDLTNVRRLLSINKKIKLEVGFTNTTGKYISEDTGGTFPILWFPQGVYVIINPSITNSTSGITISLQLKDKMCLLNGECGGVLPASTRFDEYEIIDDSGQYIIQKPTIFQILREAVNHFGGEQLGKIIISDVPDRIKQVMKWTGSKPLYVINDGDDDNASYRAITDAAEIVGMRESKDGLILIQNRSYKVYQYGDNVGYIYVDFVYPNELTFDGGSSVCDVLEAIKNLLGNYEYFYDLEGNFIFQEIKNYLNTSQSTTELKKITDIENSDYLIDFTAGKSEYQFDDSTLITSYTNTPQFQMIKNDFIVWGKKKTAEGLELPIRYHLAIDEKPDFEETYLAYLYTDPDTKITSLRVPVLVDTLPDENNPGSVDYYYTTDYHAVYRWDSETKKCVLLSTSEGKLITPSDWRYKLYLATEQAYVQGLQEDYQAELMSEFPKIFDVQNDIYEENIMDGKYEKYFNQFDGASLDYWLDFIDTNAPIMELSVKNIGKRSKVIVDDSINCLFEPAIPEVVYINQLSEKITELREEAERNGNKWSQVTDAVYSALAYGGGFNSAYDMMRSLLYQYTSYNESISLQTIPIYYLEPNTRITVQDSKSGINGDYIINSMSIPLDINSTMSLSCARVLERL